jgi:hypothetical protein
VSVSGILEILFLNLIENNGNVLWSLLTKATLFKAFILLLDVSLVLEELSIANFEHKQPLTVNEFFRIFPSKLFTSFSRGY